MKTTATQNNIHVSSQKANLVCDLVRGLPVTKALVILDNTPAKSAKFIKKLLNQAIANAVNNQKLKQNDLYVKTCYVDEGPVLKRAKMDSRGRVGRNDHKLSHITIILSERN